MTFKMALGVILLVDASWEKSKKHIDNIGPTGTSLCFYLLLVQENLLPTFKYLDKKA